MWGAAPAVGARFDREDRASAVEILLDKTKAERQTCQDACGIFFPASETQTVAKPQVLQVRQKEAEPSTVLQTVKLAEKILPQRRRPLSCFKTC